VKGWMKDEDSKFRIPNSQDSKNSRFQIPKFPDSRFNPPPQSQLMLPGKIISHPLEILDRRRCDQSYDALAMMIE